MTHMPGVPVPGEFTDEWKPSKVACRGCGGSQVFYRVWESSCGGYEDYKYECRGCGKEWWVDGIDS